MTEKTEQIGHYLDDLIKDKSLSGDEKLSECYKAIQSADIKAIASAGRGLELVNEAMQKWREGEKDKGLIVDDMLQALSLILATVSCDTCARASRNFEDYVSVQARFFELWSKYAPELGARMAINFMKKGQSDEI